MEQEQSDPLITISETLDALNTVGNYIVNMTRGVEISNYPSKKLPSALYTISKNILGNVQSKNTRTIHLGNEKTIELARALGISKVVFYNFVNQFFTAIVLLTGVCFLRPQRNGQYSASGARCRIATEANDRAYANYAGTATAAASSRSHGQRQRIRSVIVQDSRG